MILLLRYVPSLGAMGTLWLCCNAYWHDARLATAILAGVWLLMPFPPKGAQ